jgi:hypothetical protein
MTDFAAEFHGDSNLEHNVRIPKELDSSSIHPGRLV